MVIAVSAATVYLIGHTCATPGIVLAYVRLAVPLLVFAHLPRVAEASRPLILPRRPRQLHSQYG